MATTDLALWRSVRAEQFPDGTVIDGAPAPGVLFPDFHPREVSPGNTRAADVDLFKDTAGNEWIKQGGGTSLFDRADVFKGKGWRSFTLPKGTVVPESLTVRFTGRNARFAADHYQIECVAKTMRVDAFKGALDNLARNAVVRLVELAH